MSDPLVVSARFVRDKDTRNMVRYKEETADGATPYVGLIYVNKSVVEELGAPDEIRVWIAAEGVEV